MARDKRLRHVREVWGRHNPDGGVSLTPSLDRWAREHIAEDTANSSGLRAWCPCCGEEFPHARGAETAVCPHCGRELRLERSRKRSRRHSGYLQELTAWEGFQVVRTYWYDVRAERGHRESVRVERVYDWLFAGDGSRWCFSRPVCVFNYNTYTPWAYSRRELKYRPDPEGGNGRQEWRSGWRIDGVYPRGRILPWARRMGFGSGGFGDYDAMDVLRTLLVNPHFETLWKAGHRTLAGFVMYRNIDLDWWGQIKSALRAGFAFDDPQMWLDYMATMRDLGYDTLNPKYNAPADLREAHDRAMEEDRRMAERMAEDKRRIAGEKGRAAEDDSSPLNREYVRRMGKALGFAVTRGDITIRPLQSVRDFFIEGSTLGHCVFQKDYFRKKGCVVLGARVGGKRTETIEVDTRRMVVVQCRGRHNHDSHRHAEILALMEESLPKLRRLLTRG